MTHTVVSTPKGRHAFIVIVGTRITPNNQHEDNVAKPKNIRLFYKTIVFIIAINPFIAELQAPTSASDLLNKWQSIIPS